MKIKKVCVVAILLFVLQIFCVGCGYTNTEEGVLKLCVTADASNAAATAVATQTATAVQVYLADELQNARSYVSVYKAVDSRQSNVAQIASAVLRRNGYGYGVTVTLMEVSDGALLSVRLGCGTGATQSTVLFPYGDVSDSDKWTYSSLIAEWLGK